MWNNVDSFRLDGEVADELIAENVVVHDERVQAPGRVEVSQSRAFSASREPLAVRPYVMNHANQATPSFNRRQSKPVGCVLQELQIDEVRPPAANQAVTGEDPPRPRLSCPHLTEANPGGYRIGEVADDFVIVELGRNLLSSVRTQGLNKDAIFGSLCCEDYSVWTPMRMGPIPKNLHAAAPKL